jgi:hypothetical protein
MCDMISLHMKTQKTSLSVISSCHQSIAMCKENEISTVLPKVGEYEKATTDE